MIKLLPGYFSFLLLLIFSVNVSAEESLAPSALFDLSGQLPEIDPDVERRDLGLPALKSLDLEVGVYAGVMSIEDFGVNYSYGLDATFHFTEDFFMVGNMGFSTVTDQAYRRLNLPLFGENKTKSVKSNGVQLGWNFLQGEMFWGNSLVLSANSYVLFGAGVINFDSEDFFQMSTGVGMKLIPKDWLSIKVEAQFKEYESNLLGYKKYAHNTELLLGFGVNFW